MLDEIRIEQTHPGLLWIIDTGIKFDPDFFFKPRPKNIDDSRRGIIKIPWRAIERYGPSLLDIPWDPSVLLYAFEYRMESDACRFAVLCDRLAEVAEGAIAPNVTFGEVTDLAADHPLHGTGGEGFFDWGSFTTTGVVVGGQPMTSGSGTLGAGMPMKGLATGGAPMTGVPGTPLTPNGSIPGTIHDVYWSNQAGGTAMNNVGNVANAKDYTRLSPVTATDDIDNTVMFIGDSKLKITDFEIEHS